MTRRRARAPFRPLHCVTLIALVVLCALGRRTAAATPAAQNASQLPTLIEGHAGITARRNCGTPGVLCVGAGREYATIQQAADVANPGDLVQVFDGHAGFRVTRSGTAAGPISFVAAGDHVLINGPSPSSVSRDDIEIAECGFIVVDGFLYATPGVPASL